MPLVDTIQTFDIILRYGDFSAPISLNYTYDSKEQIAKCYIGKWIEVAPTSLLESTRKDLFIDVTGKTYNINNINQAIRLFIRPLAFTYTGSNKMSYLMVADGFDSNYSLASTIYASSAIGIREASSCFWLRPTYGYGSPYDAIKISVTPVETLNPILVNALGDIPESAKVSTFYLDGKFLANQPHIEHLNSGEQTIYNNIRIITLQSGETYTAANINYDNLTNGFMFNSYYANSTYDKTSDIWEWGYAQYQLKMKYITDIVDLATTYLSYGVPYKRYLVYCVSGNTGTYWTGSSYKTLNKYAYTAFEFFLAPVGEAS